MPLDLISRNYHLLLSAIDLTRACCANEYYIEWLENTNQNSTVRSVLPVILRARPLPSRSKRNSIPVMNSTRAMLLPTCLCLPRRFLRSICSTSLDARYRSASSSAKSSEPRCLAPLYAKQVVTTEGPNS